MPLNTAANTEIHAGLFGNASFTNSTRYPATIADELTVMRLSMTPPIYRPWEQQSPVYHAAV